MSFLSELKKRKDKLKETKTVVTSVSGQRVIEDGHTGAVEELTSCHGFVVDTKPDNVPVEIIPNLYIGSQDCTSDGVLDLYKIEHVLSLGINVDVQVDHRYVQCLDLPETDIGPVLAESLPFIDNALKLGENVLVHCNAGVSRTGTVAIAYLIQYKMMSYENAYDLVKSKRPAIQPNTGFRKQLIRMIQK